MIAIVDYKKGNIRSVERAFTRCGAQTVLADDPATVAAADAIVLPGVGAFADAMETLEETGLAERIRSDVSAGKPFLGICLGLHLMYEGGLEHAAGDGPTPGLGLIEGVVDALPRTDAAGEPYKVPHVGWNTVEPADSTHSFDGVPLLAGIDPGEFFYFTHSYAAPLSATDVGVTSHAVTFPSIVHAGSAFGVQFHPEKSSDAGARLIRNFVDIVSEV